MKWKRFNIEKLVIRCLCYMAVGFMLVSCFPTEQLSVEEREEQSLESELDIYIQENFTEEYGIAVRYRFVDNYVQSFQRVAPPTLENVRPMLDFVQEYWIAPYLEVENGDAFFRRYVPSELVFLGGLIYNGDGTVTLGTADAGARITFTDVNAIDPSDTVWRTQQLNTVYHEFAHIVHQEFKLPTAFETISPEGYTGAGSWFVLDDQDALERGFVSPYATSSPNEDFAETVAFFLFDTDFYQTYIDQDEECVTAECELTNTGKGKIAEKLASISDHYEKVTGINLFELREIIQTKLQ